MEGIGKICGGSVGVRGRSGGVSKGFWDSLKRSGGHLEGSGGDLKRAWERFTRVWGSGGFRITPDPNMIRILYRSSIDPIQIPYRSCIESYIDPDRVGSVLETFFL